MASITAKTLPSNFVESIDAKIRLPQPEPQYFFAMAAMAGRLSMRAIDAGASTVQQFMTAEGGGAQMSPELDRLVRFADSGMGGMIQAVDEFGKNGGDTVKFQRPLYEGGGYSKSARKVVPDKPTSLTGQNIRNEEVPIILEEYEGPYNTANSEVRPYQMRDFDAKYRKNKLSLASQVSHHLRRDYVRFLDAVIRDHMRQTSNVTLPTGVANAAAFVSGGTQYISLEQIANAKKSLSDREWQPFPDGRYKCLVPTAFNPQMIQDPDWRELSKNQAEKNLLFGQIASWQDVDFYEVTTLKSFTAGDSVDGSTVGAGVTLHEALLVGPGTVGFGTAMDPKSFFADDTDFGKAIKVIWRSIQAFATLDERGAQRILFQG